MGESRPGIPRWLLIDGNRHVVAALLVASTFGLLVLLGHAGVIAIGDTAAVRGVAGGFIPGLIAFLSIVLAINQLVLSQEFGSAGEIRTRIEDVREYRHAVEETAGSGPSPVLPTRFLSFVVRTIEAEAGSLEESVQPETDTEAHDAITRYARTVATAADRANDSLAEVQPGRINALLPVLEYDDSAQLYAARRLERDYGEALPPETRDALGDLMEALELFSVARMQFRTTYTQRVLARLSRQLLYVGLPALVVVVVLGLLDPAGTPFASGRVRLVTVSALLSLALSPLAVLAAYLLRVAAISERTIAAGPFVSRPNAVRDRSDTGERPTTRIDPPTDPVNEDR